MDPEKIGKFIYELRKERNLSQYQLADMVPISRQGVSKWERGKTIPDTQTLVVLSKIFDVSINELLNGERDPKNTIEQTTLSILDQSIKKTQLIKRITIASITIIAILLLAFLSYYFINSYNSTRIYTVGGKSKNFITRTGLFVTTREKYYFRLGKLKYNDDIEIENIKLYYKIGNKKKTIVNDNDIDNIMIKDYYGYSEKISKREINEIINNTYLEIKYNNGIVETMKLRYETDYNNKSLFFINQKQGELKVVVTKEEKASPPEEIKKEEPKKEEVKPVVNEIKQPVKQPTKDKVKTDNHDNDKYKQEESVKKNTEQENIKQEEIKEPEQPEEPVQEEPTITTEQIINKIKENCTNMNSTYACNYDNYNVIIMYDSLVNKISIYNERKYIGDYQINDDVYYCKIESCEANFDSIIEKYLFS